MLETSAAAYPNLKGVRCAVLGAGGFLGGAVASALCDNGALVHGFGRLPSHSGLDERMLWTNAWLSNTASLARALEGQQVLFHFISSSIPATSNNAPAETLMEEVYDTIKLLDLCKASGVRKVVFASSGGTVYGVPSQIPTPESAPTDPISAYGINKLMVEKFLALYRHLHGLDYVVLRLANPYGPGQSPFKKLGVIATMVHSALTHAGIEIWGTGEVTRDFVHIDDVVDALFRAAEYDGPHKTFNVGSGTGRSLNELLADVQGVLGIDDLPVVRKAGRKADVPVSILDTALIERELGWKAKVGIREGIASTAQWMRSAFRIP